MKRKLFIAVLVFLICGCSGGDTTDESLSDEEEVQLLELSLSTNDLTGQQVSSFVQGEQVELILDVTNNTDRLISLPFSCVRQYDFALIDSSDLEFWRLSDEPCDAAESELILGAGDTETFRYTRELDFPVGEYRVSGSLSDYEPEVSTSISLI